MSYMLEEAQGYALNDDVVCPNCNKGDGIALFMKGEVGYDAKEPKYEMFREWIQFASYSCECGYESLNFDDFKPEVKRNEQKSMRQD
jgi:hypothetical protein